MAPDYDDDDIVEDYEEVTTDSGVRRVNSAQGGPVKRPAGGARPSTTAMPAIGDPDDPGAPKGKITKKSARNIWIICILISVVGVGAVAADLVFGFTKGDPPPATNDGTAADNGRRIPPRERPQDLSEQQKLAQAFGVEAHKHYRGAIGSRAYDFVRLAMNDMNKKFDVANEARSQDRSDETLWAEAWIAYYNAEYALELYNHHNKIDTGVGKFKPVPDFRELAQCEGLDAADLQDPEAQRTQGVVQAISDEATKIGKHRSLLKSFAVAANVLDNEEFNGPINEAKAKLDAARESQTFDQADLDDVSRPPRGDNEPPPYLD